MTRIASKHGLGRLKLMVDGKREKSEVRNGIFSRSVIEWEEMRRDKHYEAGPRHVP